MAWSRTITNFGSTSLSYEKSVAQGEHIVLLAQDALLEEDGDLHSSDSFNWESEVSDDGVEYHWVNRKMTCLCANYVPIDDECLSKSLVTFPLQACR
jgi:hypothetical protein